MPLIRIQTSLEESTGSQELLKVLSNEISNILGKSENYVMTSIVNNHKMTFAGNQLPCCFIEIKSIGALNSNKNKEISSMICSKVEEFIGIDPKRIYIHFEDVPSNLWGWNGNTFG